MPDCSDCCTYSSNATAGFLKYFDERKANMEFWPQSGVADRR
jgi:preprotein translocase subunit Sec61beta